MSEMPPYDPTAPASTETALGHFMGITNPEGSVGEELAKDTALINTMIIELDTQLPKTNEEFILTYDNFKEVADIVTGLTTLNTVAAIERRATTIPENINSDADTLNAHMRDVAGLAHRLSKSAEDEVLYLQASALARLIATSKMVQGLPVTEIPKTLTDNNIVNHQKMITALIDTAEAPATATPEATIPHQYHGNDDHREPQTSRWPQKPGDRGPLGKAVDPLLRPLDETSVGKAARGFQSIMYSAAMKLTGGPDAAAARLANRAAKKNREDQKEDDHH